MAHRSQEIHLPAYYKGHHKTYDDLADEEVHSERSRRVLSAGVSVPVELGGTTLLARARVHQFRGSEPHSSVVFMGLYPIGMMN